jgi:hypothetical protein
VLVAWRGGNFTIRHPTYGFCPHVSEGQLTEDAALDVLAVRSDLPLMAVPLEADLLGQRVALGPTRPPSVAI